MSQSSLEKVAGALVALVVLVAGFAAIGMKAAPSLAAEVDGVQASIAIWWSQLFRCPDGPPFPATLPPLPDQRIVIG